LLSLLLNAQEAQGDFAEAERIYGKLKEENPTNPVRTHALLRHTSETSIGERFAA
jgi:hypothetical protein